MRLIFDVLLGDDLIDIVLKMDAVRVLANGSIEFSKVLNQFFLLVCFTRDY